MRADPKVFKAIERDIKKLIARHGDVTWTVLSRVLARRRETRKLEREIAASKSALAELEAKR